MSLLCRYAVVFHKYMLLLLLSLASVCLSLSLFLSLVCLSVFSSASLCFSPNLYFCLSVFAIVSASVCLSSFLCLSLFQCLFGTHTKTIHTVCLFFCVCVCMSIFPDMTLPLLPPSYTNSSPFIMRG